MPRVQIRYEMLTPQGSVQRELPFCVGVIGDYAGNAPAAQPKPVRDRKFIQVDRDNFSHVMKLMAPGLTLRVRDTLAGGDGELPVTLKFTTMEDFEPRQVAEQIEPLRLLLEARQRLKELKERVERAGSVEGLREEVLEAQEDLRRLRDEAEKK
jgi:type VI secretion system protein ImpB